MSEPTEPPVVPAARSPPQGTFEFEQAESKGRPAMWPEIDQTAGRNAWD